MTAQKSTFYLTVLIAFAMLLGCKKHVPHWYPENYMGYVNNDKRSETALHNASSGAYVLNVVSKDTLLAGKHIKVYGSARTDSSTTQKESEQLLLYFIDKHRFIYFKKQKKAVTHIELSEKPFGKSRIGTYYQFANDTAHYFVLMMTMPEVKDSIHFRMGKVILRAEEWMKSTRKDFNGVFANTLVFMEANYPVYSTNTGTDVINSGWQNLGIADLAFNPSWYFDASKAIKITLNGKEVSDIRYEVAGNHNSRIYTFENGEEWVEDINHQRIFF